MLSRKAMLPSGSHQGPLGPSSISDRGFWGWGGLVPPGPLAQKMGRGLPKVLQCKGVTSARLGKRRARGSADVSVRRRVYSSGRNIQKHPDRPSRRT